MKSQRRWQPWPGIYPKCLDSTRLTQIPELSSTIIGSADNNRRASSRRSAWVDKRWVFSHLLNMFPGLYIPCPERLVWLAEIICEPSLVHWRSNTTFLYPLSISSFIHSWHAKGRSLCHESRKQCLFQMGVELQGIDGILMTCEQHDTRQETWCSLFNIWRCVLVSSVRWWSVHWAYTHNIKSTFTCLHHFDLFSPR